MKDEQLEAPFSNEEKSMTLVCSSNDILKHILCELQEIKNCTSNRLASIEFQLSFLSETCTKISEKLDVIEKRKISNHPDNEEDSSSKLSLVPLTSEADHPTGSWLGDPKLSQKRVRSPISPSKLFHINTTCLTPIKMALVLLDNLFTQEELAFSNISGRSNKGKKQLSPILVFGIKCHLQYRFLITDKDWLKICQNMDAKCRFMYKKKNMGSSATSKLKSSHGAAKQRIQSSTGTINFDFDNLGQSNIDFNSCVKVITESPCELRIVNANPAQIAEIQESQGIILAQEMIPTSNEDKSTILMNDGTVMNTVVMDDDHHLGSHLTIPSSSPDDADHQIKGSNNKLKDDHLHEIQMADTAELTIHDGQLEDGLQLEVELGSTTDD